jgi:hypothetical protein
MRSKLRMHLTVLSVDWKNKAKEGLRAFAMEGSRDVDGGFIQPNPYNLIPPDFLRDKSKVNPRKP